MHKYVIVNEFTGQRKADCHSVLTYAVSSSFKEVEKNHVFFEKRKSKMCFNVFDADISRDRDKVTRPLLGR